MPHFLPIVSVFCGLINKVRSCPTCSSAYCELILSRLGDTTNTLVYCKLMHVLPYVLMMFNLLSIGTTWNRHVVFEVSSHS